MTIKPVGNIQPLDFAASNHAGEATIRLLENPSTASLVRHRDNLAATELLASSQSTIW